MRTRVKICGITRAEDGVAAAAAGADAIGLVFAASPRRVDAAQAQAIRTVLPPFVTAVGLFVDADPDDILAVLERVRLDVLQFHGDEPPEACAGFGLPYIKAIRMREGVDLRAEAERFADAGALLLDSCVPGKAGGTGQAFDWGRVPRDLGKPVILAGGLTPGNVAQAVRTVRPYAVDVSGGVEREKGVKDAGKIAAFIEQVRGCGS